MANGTIVNVKLKPYLKDFLIALNGTEDDKGNRFVVASKKNITGFYLFPLLEKVPIDYKPLKGDPAEILDIKVPYLDEFNVRYNCYISPVGMRHFQSAIENIFLAEFYREVSEALNTASCKLIKDAILDFCYGYEISFDNITYEMLRKKYTRYRQGMKTVRKKRVPLKKTVYARKNGKIV